MQAFPPQVQGDYAVPTTTFPFRFFKKDTAIFSIQATGIYAYGNQWDEPMLLSDSVVLSKIGKYYALSQRLSQNPVQWNVDIWLVEKNNIHAWNFDNTKPYANQLSNYFTPTVYTQNASHTWQPIPCNTACLQRLINANNPDSLVVFTLTDTACLSFIHTYVIKEKAYILKKVNRKK
jgi:hypothetical protein